MSLGASHICTSCQRSLTRDLRRRLRSTRLIRHRELSYTRLERQGAGHSGSISNAKHPVTLSNGSTGAAYDRRGPAESQDVRVGRYSRAPIEPLRLLQELPPADTSTRGPGQHTKRVDDVLKAPKALPENVKSASGLERLGTARDHQAHRPERTWRSNPVLQDIQTYQRYIRDRRNDLAWQHLCHMASIYKAEQLRVVREHSNFERQLGFAVVEQINVWFAAISSDAVQERSLPAGGEQAAFAQANEPFRPFDVCKILDTLGLLSPGLIALVLCETLYGMLKLLPSDKTGIDNAKTKATVQDVLAIWYRALASQLQPELDTSFVSHHGDSVKSIDWNFLPQEEDLESLSLAVHRSLKSVVELFLPVVVQTVSRADFSSAATLTVHLLRQLQPTSGIRPGSQDHKPLLDFWSRVLSTVVKPNAPPFILRLHDEADPRVHDQLAVLVKERGLVLPLQDRQSTTGDAETEGDGPTPVFKSKTTFAAQCDTRISRALEYHDVAQADMIFSEMLAHEQHNEGPPLLPLSSWEHLVGMYMLLRRLHRAEQVLQVMPKLGWTPNVRIYTSMVRGSSQVGDRKAVDRFWSAMIANGIMPDDVAYGARVHALVEVKRPEAALEALQEMGQMWLQSQSASQAAPAGPRKGKSRTAPVSTPSSTISPPKPTVEVGNAMISAIVGKQDDEYDKYIPAILQWLAKFGLQPNVYTYNPLINNAMKKGKVEEALTLLKQMKARGIATNSETGRGLVTGFVNSPVLDDMEAEEQTRHLLEVLDDIEINHIGAALDDRAYAILIDRILNRFANKAAADKLLARMKAQGLQPTAHIYTILLDHYMSTRPPDYAAMETLWSSIKSANKGWGAHLDDIFFDRALEQFSQHHKVLGIGKIIEILEHLPKIGKRSSYVSLLAVSHVFAERGEIPRLQKLVHDLRTMSGTRTAGRLARYGYGYKDFWEFVISLGLMREDGITSYEQLKSIGNPRRPQNGDKTK